MTERIFVTVTLRNNSGWGGNLPRAYSRALAKRTSFRVITNLSVGVTETLEGFRNTITNHGAEPRVRTPRGPRATFLRANQIAAPIQVRPAMRQLLKRQRGQG